jgi:hypothetical protein
MNSDGAVLGSSDAVVGASASSPVDVDASPTGSTRQDNEDVWQDMDEVKKVISRKEVRVGAICKCCKS